MNPAIFKAYDMRGIYPTDLNEHDAYDIGRAFVAHFKPQKIAVGQDIRKSSATLFAAFVRGVTESGVDVVDLGLTSTPMVYFAAGTLDVDAVVAITASHNPPQWNGMKFALRGAIPVGEKTGLSDIRDLALKKEFLTSETVGVIETHNIKDDYIDYFTSFADFRGKKFHIVTDTANAMGVLELDMYRRFPDEIDMTNIYDDLSHPFECHEANPLKTETLAELQAKVREAKADLGICYDGDADRVGFVDEMGEIIPMDLMTGLLGKSILERNPGATMLYDLRSSRAVKEVIEEAGGVALECRVGHANIKKQMRETSAIFAGELSGHYYFKENSYAESSTLAAIFILNLIAKSGKKASELLANLRRYSHSGEINSEVTDKDAVIAKLKEKYADGIITDLDGVKIDYPTWWFNVRPSNTEPVLRLNLEAKTREEMEVKQAQLLAIIRG
jgi:phosphomannomutase